MEKMHEKLMDLMSQSSSTYEDVCFAMDSLTNREQDVLKMYFGIGYDNPCPIEAIAQELNCDIERIKQIKAKALNRVMTTLGIQPLPKCPAI